MDNIQFDKPFHKHLINELNQFTTQQASRFPEEEILKMDMHCHDYNSDVPDELIGRILKAPETWLPTEQLLQTLERRGCNAFTITNHNNARSCYEQQDLGKDILTASEFSCYEPDYKVGIHVLTYGFTPEQEVKLNKFRGNIYKFQQYTCEHDIPTVWAHPLYHYTQGVPPFEFFKKMALLFERFEVINGQRDTWQNMLTKVWIDNLNEEGKIQDLIKETGIESERYCRNVNKKSASAGSDSHMGIFSGLTGSYLHVPNLQHRKKDTPVSKLALEAIKAGNIAPYGTHSSYEKMTIAFIDYVCQIALYHKDPGLMRIILHKGESKEKLLALGLSNAFGELRRHKTTMKFVELFHGCFAGKVPHFSKRWFVSPVYKPIYDEAKKIAVANNSTGENLVDDLEHSIFSMNQQLSSILSERLTEKIQKFTSEIDWKQFTFQKIIEHFELPSEIRPFLDPKTADKKKNMTIPDLGSFFDGLSFPFLASNLILGANFTSTKVLYNSRPLLEDFSEKIGKFKHPKRMLWLSDTFEDNNGVSTVLKALLKEIQKRDLPIDILICSNNITPEKNLIVRKPITEFTLPVYENQPFRIPNFLDIHRVFLEGEYDRVMCSTEGVMGVMALYLKQAYSVPAYHYIHTDWISFAKDALSFNHDNLSRLRRLLRVYYRNFDSVFVLNNDQKKWFSGKEIGIKKEKVFKTAHWVDENFYKRRKVTKDEVFNLDNDQKVILYAGRLSKEKGVMELPEIFKKVKAKVENVQLVIVGSGNAESELKTAMPEAIFLGWVDHTNLPIIYSASDLLILPSRFDTFSLVVLEALSCGLPVIAYKTKGPKDIIKDSEHGYLVNSLNQMSQRIIEYLQDKNLKRLFRKSALKRAKKYSSKKILNQLIKDTNLSD